MPNTNGILLPKLFWSTVWKKLFQWSRKIFEIRGWRPRISINFKIPIIFSNLNSNCSCLLDMRNFQVQVKKAFCYQKLFWPFIVWTNCWSDLKKFANSRPSASNFKCFSRYLKQFFSHSRSEQFWWKKYHGLRTSNEGLNQRYMKNLANLADKICFGCAVKAISSP